MVLTNQFIKKSLYILKKTKNIVFILNIDRIIKLIKNFNFLSDLNVFSLHKDNVYKSFKKLNIKVLLGFNSSLLVECSYYNILPVILINGKKSVSDLIKDGLFYQLELKMFQKFY